MSVGKSGDQKGKMKRDLRTIKNYFPRPESFFELRGIFENQQVGYKQGYPERCKVSKGESV